MRYSYYLVLNLILVISSEFKILILSKMGKKDNKKKGKGAEKTAAKTEKKTAQKIKKDLKAKGEASYYRTLFLIV